MGRCGAEGASRGEEEEWRWGMEVELGGSRSARS